MTENSSRVEISYRGHDQGMPPFQQRSVQLFILAASIAACTFFAWNFPQRPDGPPPAYVGVEVDLNTASSTELSLVPGIGPRLAERILENRHRLGEFPNLESLQRVHGIGPKTAERVAIICVVEKKTPRVVSR